MDNLQQSKPERIASAIFTACGNFKNLIGLAAIGTLTAISLTFNYHLGELMGSDSVTAQLFPVGFAALDCAALFLAAWLTMRSRSVVRKGIAWVWLGFLVALSVWAAMSFTLASDAKLQQAGTERLKAAKLAALEQANQRVDQAQHLYNNPGIYKMRRARELEAATQARDALLTQIQSLNEKTPPAGMAIYNHTAALLQQFGTDISAGTIAGLVRMLWALALTLSPFVLTSLLAFEVAKTRSAPTKKPMPEKVPERSFPPENEAETHKKPALKLHNFVKKGQNKAESKQTPISDRKQGKNLVCEQSVQQVAEWLATQSGRVKRDQIKYRCRSRGYDDVSQVIAELQRRKLINRQANGQLIVNRAKTA